MALQINDQNFEEYLKADKPLVLDFWAEWCGPCRMIAPYIDEITEQFGDKVNIGKVNVDSCPEITGKYGIRNIPTVLFIKNGEIVDKQVGATTKAALAAKVEKLC
ncbi:MAG: thioredoxin [Bacteroidales bacterium]|jgi:thioredoxin 1|nr:thioredoxin [Bacteroidales bacterium]MDD2205506.1 thioredoxin [Bacteroidales bacterium]MDD3151556.1 thioredoxin [Bacteroidales bacterium]MDD3914912.1 thioredoxin [Bacteroidales bacterium]MDD4634764.1 thioredoxin [Bacteroidales bacterium]